MINIIGTENEKVMHMEVSGKVTKEEIHDIAAAVDAQIRVHGKMNVIVELKEFKGYTISGFFEDFKYGLAHRDSFNRLAVVGDSKIEEVLVNISNIILSGEIKFFYHKDLEIAKDWVNQTEKVRS
jgi:hypothetical protein